MSAITRFIPKNHISYFVGQLVHIPLPRFLSKIVIMAFAKAYNISLAEAEFPVDHYPSLGEFFIRRLKPGLRPVADTWAVHPADSVITQAAPIASGRLIQAKNKTYSVESFTRDSRAMEKYDKGTFLTYYLCPTDYHRVHSPVTGEIKKVAYIPGALWPVNAWSTENIHELFSVNERVLVEIETDRGLVGVMFVGATNVGQIELAFDKEIRGNQLLSDAVQEKTYTGQKIQKGEELGMFRMGSTIVMLYAPNTIAGDNLSEYLNKQVRVNAKFSN